MTAKYKLGKVGSKKIMLIFNSYYCTLLYRRLIFGVVGVQLVHWQ